MPKRLPHSSFERHLPRAHVLTLGDNAYPDNSPANYAKYYTPTWGRFKSITGLYALRAGAKPAPASKSHAHGALFMALGARRYGRRFIDTHNQVLITAKPGAIRRTSGGRDPTSTLQ